MTTPPLYTLEIAQATLRDDCDEATLLARSQAMQTSFLDQQPGFLQRQFVRFGPGQYGAVVTWQHRTQAETAMAQARSHPAVLAFADCLAPGTYRVQLVEVIAAYATP